MIRRCLKQHYCNKKIITVSYITVLLCHSQFKPIQYNQVMLICYLNTSLIKHHNILPGPLHKFPSWEYPHTERFNKWKMVLRLETQDRGNKYIYNSIRLCYRHFEDFYQSNQSHQLTKNAIPTLNLGKLKKYILIT